MNDFIHQSVLGSTGSVSARRGELIASLWSGYGEIVRMHLEGTAVETVVLKEMLIFAMEAINQHLLRRLDKSGRARCA